MCIKTRQPSDEDEVYLVPEVAKKLRMSERGAYDFCSETKEFKVLRCGPRLIRINKESFDAWFDG